MSGMSSKSDKWLGSTGLVSVWNYAEKAGQTRDSDPQAGENPGTDHQQAPAEQPDSDQGRGLVSGPSDRAAPDADPDDADEYIPPSIVMLSGMISGIFGKRYLRPMDVNVYAYAEEEDERYCIALYPAAFDEIMSAKDAPAETPDIYTDPDFHSAIQEFFNDLDQFSIEADVTLYPDVAEISGASKMDLYRMVSEYISDPDFLMSTPDTSFPSSDLDPEIAREQMAYRQGVQAKEARKFLSQLERERELGGIDPLYAVNNSPYSTVKEFEQACYIDGNADLPYALTHILRTICYEDNIDYDDCRFMVKGGKLTFGGYN